jgi:hypothetical protein
VGRARDHDDAPVTAWTRRALLGGALGAASTLAIGAAPGASPFGLRGVAIGDSISANYGAQLENEDIGFLTHWLALMDYRLHLPKSGLLAVAGYTIAQVAATVPPAIGQKPIWTSIEAGRNDLPLPTSADDMLRAFIGTILGPLEAGGVHDLIVWPIPPCGINAGETSITTEQEAKRQAFNRGLYELGRGRSDLMALGKLSRRPVVIDVDAAMGDKVNGGALPLTTLDKTHPNNRGAMLLGLQGFKQTATRYPKRREDFANSGLISLGAGGLMTGAGGQLIASNGVAPEGRLADGWRAYRQIGSSSTTAMICGKENPRTDGGPGERQVITLETSASGSGAAEMFTVDLAGFGIGDLRAGDVVVLTAKVEILAGHRGLMGVQSFLFENGSGQRYQAQGAQDLGISLVDLVALSDTGGPRLVYYHTTAPFAVQDHTASLTAAFNVAMLGRAGDQATFMISDVQPWKMPPAGAVSLTLTCLHFKAARAVVGQVFREFDQL